MRKWYLPSRPGPTVVFCLQPDQVLADREDMVKLRSPQAQVTGCKPRRAAHDDTNASPPPIANLGGMTADISR